eukprot:2569360-Rhodomonas_salina.3
MRQCRAASEHVWPLLFLPYDALVVAEIQMRLRRKRAENACEVVLLAKRTQGHVNVLQCRAPLEKTFQTSSFPTLP